MTSFNGNDDPPWLGRIALVVLCVAAALYVGLFWAVRYVPSQDGPSHLANAQLLRDLATPGASPGEERYYILKHPFPNWGYYVLVAAFSAVYKPLVAEKLFLSLYVIAFAWVFYRIARAAGSRAGAAAAALAALPFAVAVPFHMGFFNYCAGVVLFLGGTGFLWSRRRRVGWREIAVLNVLALAAYFFHLVPALLLLGSCHLLAFFVVGGWSRRVQVQLGLLPGWAMPLYYVVSRWGGTRVWISKGDLASSLSRGWPLISLGEWQSPLGYVGFGVAALALVWAIATLARRRRLIAGDAFALLFVAALVLYFTMPDTTSDGSMVSARLSAFPFLFAFLWAATTAGKKARFAALAIGGTFAVAYWGGNALYYRGFNEHMREFESGYCAVKEGGTIVYFDHTSYTDYEVKRNAHLDAYYVLMSRAVSFCNYEADNAGFPVNFKTGEGRPNTADWGQSENYNVEKFAPVVDYIITWQASPFGSGVGKISKCYEKLIVKPRLRVYAVKRKYRTAPR